MTTQPDKWQSFLSALSETLDVTESARQAGVTRQGAYWRRQTDEAFQAAWDAATQPRAVYGDFRAIREGLGLSRQALAARCGVSTRAVFRWEAGGTVRGPARAILDQIVKEGSENR